jgi:hypothetical protein
MGREAQCDVLARKTPVAAKYPRRAGTPEYTYSDCAVIDATFDLPSDCAVIDATFDLPDGEYLIHFDGHTIAATKQGAYWLSRGIAKRDREPILVGG